MKIDTKVHKLNFTDFLIALTCPDVFDRCDWQKACANFVECKHKRDSLRQMWKYVMNQA